MATTVAPVLSTPDTHIFEDPTPVVVSPQNRLPDELLFLTYEIERTVREIRAGRWKRIALQFPDHMLCDAPRVAEALGKGLKKAKEAANATNGVSENLGHGGNAVEGITKELGETRISEPGKEEVEVEERLTILGDTSYGACCVDEVAAEHVDADVVVHYGRACLSPTARLPVIYVFTTRAVDMEKVVESFKKTYPEKNAKVVLMADIPYSHHVTPLLGRLQKDGYENVFATEVIHDPASQLPNRTVPVEVVDKPDALRDYQLFHIAEPPTSLLLTLSSRVGAIHIYPTESTEDHSSEAPSPLLASSAMTLRRRYALLTSLSTVDVYGILINTLSVKNYLHMLQHVKDQITAAGKKYYTFVVGKVNAAKVANFSEVGGWVVIGCWESSLIESKDFWRPMITPFELGLALQSDEKRVWTGEWRGDFQAILEEGKTDGPKENGTAPGEQKGEDQNGEYDDEEESEPPEFDLRTGRYVSHSRPMRATTSRTTEDSANGGVSAINGVKSLVKRANGDIAQVGGVVSLGAEFLRSKRTWQGLGSDFEIAYDEEVQGAPMEEGRSGLAKGYVVGDDRSAH